MNDLRDFCIRVEERYSGSNSGNKSDAYILTWDSLEEQAAPIWEPILRCDVVLPRDHHIHSGVCHGRKNRPLNLSNYLVALLLRLLLFPSNLPNADFLCDLNILPSPQTSFEDLEIFCLSA